MNKNKKSLIYFSILFMLAFFLRVFRLGLHLPYFPTLAEAGIAEFVYEFFNGQLTPPSFQYPSLIYYLTSLPIFILSFLPVIGRFLLLPEPSSYIMPCRVIVFLISMAQFPLIYGIGRRAYGERAALLSLLILALSPLHIKYSTLVNPDMLMVFFVLLTIWYLTKNSLNKEINIKTAIIAGGLCGLALASKHPGLAVILPLLYLIFLSDLPKIKTTILALGSTLFVFLLTNPFVLINIKSFIFDMGSEFSRVITSYPFEEVSKAAWGLYLLTIIAAVGEGVFISAVFGTVSGFIKNRKKEIFLMLFPVVYFGVMGGFKIFIAYYMLPVLPFVAISAGRFFDHILEYLNIKKGAIIIVIILIPSLYRAGNLLLLESGTDTRITAKEWVLNNIPENSRILIDSVKAHSEPFLKFAQDSAFNPFYITTIKAEADHLDYINKLEEENYDYSLIIDGKPKSMQERVLIDDYIKDKYPLIKQISPSIPKPFIPYIYHVAYDNPLILIHKLKLPQEE